LSFVKNNDMNKRQGFTLIELLVVIAIIAILAAILFPVFAQAKLAAKKSVSISNVKQVTLGGLLYAGDYDDVSVPLYWFDPNELQLPSTQGFYYWSVLLLPYTKNEKIFLCPQDTMDDPFLGDGTHGRFDPASTIHYYAMGVAPSYGLNYRYLNTQVNDAVPGPSGLPFHYEGNSLTALANPASTIQFAEATIKDKANPNTGQVVTSTVGYSRIEPPSRWMTSVAYPDARSQGQLWGRFDPKKVIVGWLDGHVKYTAINQLKVNTWTTVEEQDQFWNGTASK